MDHVNLLAVCALLVQAGACSAPATPPAETAAACAALLERSRHASAGTGEMPYAKHVSASVTRAMPAIRRCYRATLAAQPGRGGRVTVDFKVAPDGTISGVQVAESTASEDVQRCVVKQLEATRVRPAPGAELTVTGHRFEFCAH